MDIKRNGSQPSATGPAGYFTGAVRIDPLFDVADPARHFGAYVTFEPGARRPGTPTRWARRSSSPPAAAAPSAGADL